MADKEGFSSFTSISLLLIEKHEKEYMMVLLNNSKVRDSTLEIKLKLQSLEAVCNISNDEDFKMCMCELSENVMQELQSLSGRPINEGLVKVLGNAYDKLKKEIDWVLWNPSTDINNIFQFTIFKTKFDFVLKSLGDYKANEIAPSIKEKLLLLHDLLAYVGDTIEGITIGNKDLLDPLMDSVFKAACLLYSCLVGKKEEPMELEMMHNLSNYVKKIFMAILKSSMLQGFMKDSFKGEIYLLDNVMRLLNCTSSSRIDLKDACEKLHDKLKFLKTFLAYLPHKVIIEDLIHFTKFIENMTCATLHIFQLCYDKEMKEDLFIRVNGVLADVIDQIEDIQLEVEDIKVYNAPKSDVDEITLPNYPKTDPLGFLDLFLGHVGELLKSQPKMIKYLKNDIETLKDEFDLLRSLLKQIMEFEEYEDVRARIIQLAYQAEHVIDCYLVKHFSNRRIKFTLSKITENMKIIQSDVTRINGEKKYVTRADTVEKTFNNVPSQAMPAVVGFEDVAEKIKDEFLFGETKKRDVISIVGLPGLGKTTLARKLFEDPLVNKHFDVQAWCTVSQTYRKRDVLLTMLGNIKRTEEINTLDDEELAAKLRKSLLGHRYIILIDDLWNIEDWNDLARSFPDENCHSRIIITSRLHNVASQIRKVHLLREFSDNESWELFEMKLFQNKLFQKESFSKDFQEVGIKIVKSCKGLPLAIVEITSLLSKQEKSVDKWKEVAKNIRSRILSESESQCKVKFELSYNNLSDELKSCLLSLGAFEEDEEIPLSKLKQMWIAEGFVRETNGKNLEDLADEYSMDLISRSLLKPIEERSIGGVKSCHVHDLVHEFCLIKAEEENFLQVICTDDDLKLSSIHDHRRLRINSDLGQFIKATLFGWRTVRSLFNTKQDTFMSLLDSKLLRVLDLDDVETICYLSGIETLIHLRNLQITAKGLTSIPSSISNLWNLQFLRLKCSDWRTIVSVPDSLWDMVHLRNVNITPCAYFEVHPGRLNNSVLLENLDTLATPCLSNGKDAVNLLKRLPNLRKLSCIFFIEDDTKELLQYPALDFLDQLTSLKVTFKSLLHMKKIELKFPSKLKKVSLWNFPGDWNDISSLGRMLTIIEVLKFSPRYTMDHDIWVVKDGDFPMLKYLRFSGVNLEQWSSSEDSFPVLEKLVLKYCHKLKEIPPCFGDITTLEMISVDYCNQSLCDSVKKVQKNQEEDFGYYGLKVNITNDDNDGA